MSRPQEWTFAPGLIAKVVQTGVGPALALYHNDEMIDAVSTRIETEQGLEWRLTSVAWKEVSKGARRILRDRKSLL